MHIWVSGSCHSVPSYGGGWSDADATRMFTDSVSVPVISCQIQARKWPIVSKNVGRVNCHGYSTHIISEVQPVLVELA